MCRPQAVQDHQPAAAAALLLLAQEACQVPSPLLLLQALLRWVLPAFLQQDPQAAPVQEGRAPGDSMCHHLWGLWAMQQHLAAAVLLLLLEAQHAQQEQARTLSWGGSPLGVGLCQLVLRLAAAPCMGQQAPIPQQQMASSFLMQARALLLCPLLSLSREAP
jgi:hypothetical protein